MHVIYNANMVGAVDFALYHEYVIILKSEKNNNSRTAKQIIISFSLTSIHINLGLVHFSQKMMPL